MTPPLLPSPAVPPAPEPIPPPPGTAWVEHALVWATQRPWLAAVAVGLLAGYAVAHNQLSVWRHRHHADNARLVTIAPPPEVDAHGAAALWANIAGILTPSWRNRIRYGTPHVVWQYTWTGRELLISLWVPGTIPPGAVEAAIRGAWPGAATTTQEDAPPPIPLHADPAAGGHLLPRHPDWLPFNTDHDADPLRALMSAGAQLHPDEHTCVQILARPAPPRRARRARRAAARLREGKTAIPQLDLAAPIRELVGIFLPSGGSRTSTARRVVPAARRDPTVERDVRAILDKTTHPLWETGIRYAVATTNTRQGADPTGRLRGIADALASSYAVYSGRNRLTHRTRMNHPVAVLQARRLGAGFLTSLPELSAMAALPQDLAVPGLDRARAKSMPVPVAVPSGGRGHKILGDAEIGGHTIAQAVADARYHTHMVGQTGSGKTTLLANMIIDDILAGRGTVVLDPHGDLVLDILDRLPNHVADRVVLFDPAQKNPAVLNPLESEGPEDELHDLIVDNIVSIFGSIFAKAWGPRMDDVMRVACLTLLKHPNVTLQHISPLLISAQFRSEMTVDLEDMDGLAGFWQWYDSMNEAMRAQIIGPVLARLRSFLLRGFVKKTMRSPKSSFNMGEVLDGKVLLVRIPKGVLGEETSKLLGSLILARVWQAATARATIPVEQRKDASIYLDECQNFLTLASSLDSMLAEARKYRLSMVLAHQDLAQFPKELLAAASANARNKIYFSVAPEDARVLGRHTLPELDEHDLAHLDAYTAAARLVVDGRQTAAFTMKTRGPRAVIPGAAQHIRETVDAKVKPQDTSVVDEVVRRATRKENDRRTRRTKKDPDPGNP